MGELGYSCRVCWPGGRGRCTHSKNQLLFLHQSSASSSVMQLLGLNVHVGDLHLGGQNPRCFFVMPVRWDRTASFNLAASLDQNQRSVCRALGLRIRIWRIGSNGGLFVRPFIRQCASRFLLAAVREVSFIERKRRGHLQNQTRGSR